MNRLSLHSLLVAGGILAAASGISQCEKPASDPIGDSTDTDAVGAKPLSLAVTRKEKHPTMLDDNRWSEIEVLNFVARAKSLQNITLAKFQSGEQSLSELQLLARAVETIEDSIQKDMLMGSLFKSFFGDGDLDERLESIIRSDADLREAFGGVAAFNGGTMHSAIYDRLLLNFQEEAQLEDFLESVQDRARDGGMDSFVKTAMPIVLAKMEQSDIFYALDNIGSDELRKEVERGLIDRWIHSPGPYGRKLALKVFLSGELAIGPTDGAMNAVFNKGWFTRNASDVSQQILEAASGPHRDTAIKHMIDLISQDDPDATQAWIKEIQDINLRSAIERQLALNPD